MIGTPFELAHDDENAIDMVEELAETKGWEFCRQADASISVTLPIQKTQLDATLEWQDEFSALLFGCSFPIEICDANYEMMAKALEQINQNMWLGHFDLSNKGKYPTFRHTLLLRMIPPGLALDMISDVFEIAMAECNRFYSTFQLAQAGDTRLHEDLSAAVFETVGEA